MYLNYKTQEELRELRSSGCTESEVAAFEQYHAKVEALILQIERTFADVRLGDGIGLWLAHGLDDHRFGSTLDGLDALDEREDWRELTDDELNHCESSLSFFDAKGMRFHLPAFMRLDLRDRFHCGGLDFRLSSLNENRRKPFQHFTSEEKACVADYIELKLETDDFEYEEVALRQAIKEFWRPSS